MDDLVLPASVEHLRDVIERSRGILDEVHNGIGYKESTWRRAIQALIDLAEVGPHDRDGRLIPPRISAGHWGEIHVSWWLKHESMVIEVPVQEDNPATFRAGDREGHWAFSGVAEPGLTRAGLLERQETLPELCYQEIARRMNAIVERTGEHPEDLRMTFGSVSINVEHGDYPEFWSVKLHTPSLWERWMQDYGQDYAAKWVRPEEPEKRALTGDMKGWMRQVEEERAGER